MKTYDISVSHKHGFAAYQVTAYNILIAISTARRMFRDEFPSKKITFHTVRTVWECETVKDGSVEQ